MRRPIMLALISPRIRLTKLFYTAFSEFCSRTPVYKPRRLLAIIIGAYLCCGLFNDGVSLSFRISITRGRGV